MDFFAEDLELLERYLGAPIEGGERRAASLTASGEASLSVIRCARRMELFWPVLWERMLPLLSPEHPLAGVSAAAVPKQARQDALQRVLEDVSREGGAASLYERYPELERIDRLTYAGFVRLLDELFRALEEKRGEIAAAFFGGRDFGKVTAVCLPRLKDVGSRPGSRMTLRLETEGGRFYFKPRVCAAENLYAQLTERLFPEIGRTCRVVVGDYASFTENIETAPLASMDEAAEYFRRLGEMNAVFFALQSGDMHAGNILPQGKRPVPIDLECLLRAEPAGEVYRPPHVAASTMLAVAVNSGRTNSPLYAPRGNERGLLRLPQLDGRPVTVLQTQDSYLAGFKEGGRRILENAGEWRRVIREHPEVPVRVQLRSHGVYGLILRGMLKPAQLRSAAARDAWLERVWAQSPAEQRAQLRELEREDFLNLDIPDFYLLAGEDSARRWDGTVAMAKAFRPPVEYEAQRLGSLSEEELHAASEELLDVFARIRARDARH